MPLSARKPRPSIRQALRRSVAAKLLLGVALAMVAVIGIYTSLISQSRQAWLAERLTLSQVLVRDHVRDYYTNSMGDHPADQTTAFLDAICRDTGIEQIQILPADWQPPSATSPQDPSHMDAANSLLVGPVLGRAFVPTSNTQRVWQGAIPLPSGRQCQECHADQAGGALAMLVMDYPAAKVEGMVATDRLRLASYGGILLLSTLAIVLAITWWLVLEPLYRLSTCIARVRSGDLDAVCLVDSPDQIGRLSEGFNHMLGAIRDRDQEQRCAYETSIVRAERLATVGQLASGLAHEIKNPLHSVSAALQIVTRHLKEPELREVAADMQSELARVSRIVQDLLAYARPAQANCRPTDLVDVVDRTIRLATPEATTSRLSIHMEAEAGLPTLSVDPEQIHQVLLNLLLNAIQVAPPGGHVQITIGRTESSVHITVADDGPGIATADRERIFEPFFTTRSNGHGLGLPICRTLVEQNGGRIDLLDPAVPGCDPAQAPGHGAAFRVTLPITQSLPDRADYAPPTAA